jgi:hypothetical protein
MVKNTSTNNKSIKQESISGNDIDLLLKKVRDFQEENKKYLITIPNANTVTKLSIINMANTSY